MTPTFYELQCLEDMHHIKRNNSTWSIIITNFLKAPNVGVHVVYITIKKMRFNCVVCSLYSNKRRWLDKPAQTLYISVLCMNWNQNVFTNSSHERYGCVSQNSCRHTSRDSNNGNFCSRIWPGTSFQFCSGSRGFWYKMDAWILSWYETRSRIPMSLG